MSAASQLHPQNDPRLLSRHESYTQNPANDPLFLFRVLDEMETDDALREFVHNSFITGELSWLLHDSQRFIEQVIVNADGECLILCSRQIGKSFFILLFGIMHCAHKWKGRNPLVRILCQTQKQVNEIVQDNMSVLLPLAPPGWIKATKSEARWRVGLGEIRIGMISAAHVDSKRGGNASLVITEEGGFAPSDSFKDAMQFVVAPQLLRSEGLLVHVSTPSKDEQHYLLNVVLPKCDIKGSLVRLTVYDNPQLSNEQIVKAFELIDDGTDEAWRREYLVEIVKAHSLLAIPEFTDERHVSRLIPPPHACWATILDFGGSLDPHGVSLTYWDHTINKWCIYRDALVPVNTSIADVIKIAWDLEDKHLGPGRHLRVIDCSGQVSIEINRLERTVDGRVQRFTHMNPTKGPGSFDASLQALRVAFQNGQILVDEAAKHSRAMLKYGKLNKQRDDFLRAGGHHNELIACAMYGFKHKSIGNPTPAPNPYTTYHTKSGWELSDSAASFQKLANLHLDFE